MRLFVLLRRVIAVCLLLGGLVYGAHEPFRSAVDQRAEAVRTGVLDVVRPRLTPVHPVEVTADAERADRPAAHASDGLTTTAWAAPSDAEAVLTLRLDRPVELRRAIVRVGLSDAFTSTGRPHRVHVVYSGPSGAVATQDLELADTADPQEVDLDSEGPVASLSLQVLTVYRGEGPLVALTELELFGRR
jgi:hypothetical protein